MLTPICSADADALFAIQSDTEVMRYWNHPAWTDARQAQQQTLDDMAATTAGTQLKLAIRERAGTPLLGICVMFAIDESSGRAEIGYNLAPRAQSNGYMCEALARVVSYLFDERGLRRLEAEAEPRN